MPLCCVQRAHRLWLYSVMILLQERLFDDCAGTTDIPVKPFKRVVLHSPLRSGNPPMSSGKRKHPVNNSRNSTIIYIDDDDDDDRDEFVPKKQRIVSYDSSKSSETERHVHYSSSPSSEPLCNSYYIDGNFQVTKFSMVQ